MKKINSIYALVLLISSTGCFKTENHNKAKCDTRSYKYYYDYSSFIKEKQILKECPSIKTLILRLRNKSLINYDLIFSNLTGTNIKDVSVIGSAFKIDSTIKNTKLRLIRISSNSISISQNALCGLDSLKTLEITTAQLKIPIFQIPANLESLTISGKYENIPGAILISKVSQLKLESNSIYNIDKLSELTSLKGLDIVNTKLGRLLRQNDNKAIKYFSLVKRKMPNVYIQFFYRGII